MIIVMPPSGQRLAGMGQTGEQCLVEAFVPDPGIEAVDEPVLLRLARCDVVPLDLPVLRPFEDRHIQRPCHACARY